MIPEIRVDGARQLAQLSRAMANATPELRRELARGIREGTEPLKQEAINNIEPTLPSRGGLAAAVKADTKIVTVRRGRGANPGVRLTARSRRNVRRMDRGRLRKPLFGNRDFWYTQQIPPGWFSTPMVAGAPRLRRVLVEHLNIVGKKISRSV